MEVTMALFMKKIVSHMSLLALLTLCVTFLSCGGEVSAFSVMTDFKAMYASEGIIYSNEVAEGEAGFCDGDFFGDMYGEPQVFVESFATFLTSRGGSVGECAIFVAQSEYEATLLLDLCFERIELIRSIYPLDTASESAFVMRCGRSVVMCAMPDNEKARRILEKLL